MRLVNRGFETGQEWDADYDGMSGGWPVFMEQLRLHLTYFAGRHARATITTVMVAGPHARAWSALCAALGIGGGLAEGAAVTTGEGPSPLAGTIVSTVRKPGVTAYHLLLEPPGGGKGFVTVEGEGDQVACSVYLYRYGRDEDGPDDDAWTSWLPAASTPVGAPAPGAQP